MEKNWLIRTHRNQILGPVSREKVLDLLAKGSLKSNDEICSGNGFWFKIKEANLLQKYIHQLEKQSFDPISEVGDHIEADITQVGQIDLSQLKQSIPEATLRDDEGLLPQGGDLEYPDLGSVQFAEENQATSTGPALDDEDHHSAPSDLRYEEPEETKGTGEFVYPGSDELEYPSDDPGSGEIRVELSAPESEDLTPEEEIKDDTSPDLKLESHKGAASGGDFHESVSMAEIRKRKPAIGNCHLVFEHSPNSVSKPIESNNEELPKRNDRYLIYILAAFILVIVVAVVYYSSTSSLSYQSPLDVIIGSSYAEDKPVGDFVKKKP